MLFSFFSRCSRLIFDQRKFLFLVFEKIRKKLEVVGSAC